MARTAPAALLIEQHNAATIAETAYTLANQSWPIFRRYIKAAIPNKYRQEDGDNLVVIAVIQQDRVSQA